MTVGITDCIYMLISFLVQFFGVVKGKASELVTCLKQMQNSTIYGHSIFTPMEKENRTALRLSILLTVEHIW